MVIQKEIIRCPKFGWGMWRVEKYTSERSCDAWWTLNVGNAWVCQGVREKEKLHISDLIFHQRRHIMKKRNLRGNNKVFNTEHTELEVGMSGGIWNL